MRAGLDDRERLLLVAERHGQFVGMARSSSVVWATRLIEPRFIRELTA
jgi:hypothetical protein